LPVTTLLLLPLAPWIDEKGRRAWLYMAPFVLLGLWMQATHVGVNWIYTVYSAGYGYEQDVFKPKYAFIFVPHVAPVVAMSKALLAGDYRVDMWLVNLYRELGPGYLWKPLAVWVLALALSAWRFYRSIIPDRGEPHPP